MLRDLANFNQNGVEDQWNTPDEPLAEGEYWEGDEEDNEDAFVNFALLSNLAVQLKDKVPRGTHVKGSIPYPKAFTGKDIVSTIQQQIQRELLINHNVSTSDRRAALQIARSLQSQLFFYEVEWGNKVLQDGVEDVYMFLDDIEGGGGELSELPSGVVTMMTRCYSIMCEEGVKCYAYGCPRSDSTLLGPQVVSEPALGPSNQSWATKVEKEIIESLPESEINRQTIIHKIISKEEAYIEDLNTVEKTFINPLLQSQGVIPPDKLHDFIDVVFSNILDLRECNKRLLENLYVRQREQSPVIQRIGDIFLEAATEFRFAYPNYMGSHQAAERRLKEEMDNNVDFRMWLEAQSRNPKPASASDAHHKLDLKHLLNRPPEHLQKYPVLLDAIHNETARGNPDGEFLVTAIDAIRSLNGVAQLKTFQMAMGRGTPGKWEWHDLAGPEVREKMTKDEMKRQAIIFELIKGEMAYVKDLENIGVMYIQPLLQADPPIIPQPRLNQFIASVFNNYADLHQHHLRLLDRLHHIQREQHPVIRSVSAAMLDAVLHFREAYMEYIPNYPIAAWRIDSEMRNNPEFKTFVDQCVRHPDAHRLDMQNFINRPIPRLLRYELLLKSIHEETPPGHEDKTEIPNVLDLIKALGKETEPGVVSAKQKVELWKYNEGLVFKPGESVDMDLLDENRSLIFAGKVMRQPEGSLEWSSWSELFVLLFDNYLVMTKPKERDGATKYQVNRRPIPLDLLTMISFSDPPTQRSAGLLQNLRGGGGNTHQSSPSGSHIPSPEFSSTSTSSNSPSSDSRLVYPFTLHQSGRAGGTHILFAESAAARTEWKQKLEEALGLRKVVQEANKVFEIETLSIDTFLLPSMMNGTGSGSGLVQQPSYEGSYTGRVTCSVPFNTADGRGLVAIGCAEGVWIGFRHDPKSMRRVLHLKMVTQCAMLDDFGIFLVLADKSLFAYHIEALVPSTPHAPQASQVPQKLNGTKDVHFFSVGNLHGRTLVIYMKKKGLDSIFRVLEPVGDKINERSRQPAGFGSKLGFRSAKSEWFRIYRDFFLPSESFDLIFLKAKIAILCTKGFEIMDLYDFKSVTIPQREDPRLAYLSKRCEQCRPIAMYRSTEDEFLLCYDEFGIYVDKHGDPSRSTGGVIEWEGRAERVAQHNPFILLFDSRFIEIRSLETGRLVQIIPGTEVRCIWDGRGVGNNVAQTPRLGPNGGELSELQDAKVHAVMNAPEMHAPGSGGRGASSRVVTQLVFELIPTLPLDYQDGRDSYIMGGESQFSSMQSTASYMNPRSDSQYWYTDNRSVNDYYQPAR
ncbi:CNH domain-containing protein [Flagelloscypha sp. PMI_526]|nr:CNH domain-containing protein [Flagelloscypha sp. PMI_526]